MDLKYFPLLHAHEKSSLCERLMTACQRLPEQAATILEVYRRFTTQAHALPTSIEAFISILPTESIQPTALALS